MNREWATFGLGVFLVFGVVVLSVRNNLPWLATRAERPEPQAAAAPLPAAAPPSAPLPAAAPASTPPPRAAAPPSAPLPAAAPASTPPPRAAAPPSTPPPAAVAEPAAAPARPPAPEPARIDAAIPVIHKHRLGSCHGTLRVTPFGLAYSTPFGNDAFRVSFAEVEQLELNREGDNLRLRQRGGRTWNFGPRGDRQKTASLTAFYGQIERARRLTAR